MFDSQLYPFVGRSRRLPLRDNNGRCVNQEGKHELHMIINFGQVNTSYLSSFTAIVKVPQHTLANLTRYCPSYSRQTSYLF